MAHRFDTFKLLPLLDLLQFAHIIQRFLLEVLPHGFHLAVGLRTHGTHVMIGNRSEPWPIPQVAPYIYFDDNKRV